MSHGAIRFLLIEDNPGDARLIKEMLADTGDRTVTLECADRLQPGIESLASGEIDGILLDLSLPDSHGFETFARTHSAAPDIPIIVLSGLDEEDLAVRAVREGAQDYLVKGEVDGNLLLRAMRYGIERKRLVQQTEQRARELSALNRVITAVGGSLDLNEILEKAFDSILEVTGMEAGHIRLYEGTPPQFKLMAHRGLSSALIETLRRGLRPGGTSDRVLAAKCSVILRDPSDQNGEHLGNQLMADGFNTGAWVPILLKDRAVGIINVLTRARRPVNQDQVSLLESIGASLGVALENANLYRDAQRNEEIQRLLKELSQDITSPDIDNLLKSLSDKVRTLLRVDMADVRILAGESWHVKGVSGIDPEALLPADIIPQGRSEWIVKNRRALMIPDITQSEEIAGGRTLKSLGIRGYLGVPLFSRNGEVKGVLRALSYQPRVFTQEEIDLLQQFANGAAIATENALLFEESQQRSRELQALVKINRDIAGLLDQETLLPRIGEQARKLFNMDSASFRLIKGEEFVLTGSVGAKRSNSPRVKVAGSVAERLVREGGILSVRNAFGDPSIRESRRQALAESGYISIAGAPLRVADRTIGIILLYSKEEKELSPMERELLTSFADQAAIAIENARLYAEVQQRTHELSTLVRINRDIATLTDRGTLLPRLVEEARTLLRMDSGSLRLVEGEDLVLKGHAGDDLNFQPRISIAASAWGRPGFTERVLTGQHSFTASPLPAAYHEKRLEEGYRSYIAASLNMVGRMIGVVTLYSRDERTFSSNEIDLISRFTDQAAIALENARLYEETKKQALQLHQDIAQRKLAEEQLKQANADLTKSNEELKVAQMQIIQAAKLESVGRLAAGVAHEVKNPLEIILMSAEFLSKKLTDRDEQTTMLLDDIDYAVKRADSVVRGLLDFSASEEIRADIEEVNAAVEGALFLVKHQLDRSHIALVKNLAKRLPLVKLDKGKVQQVFVNLFMNAVHAMEGGGILTVKTYSKRLSATYHRRQDASDGFKIGETLVIVEVEDTGTGIPEQQLSKIFDPFFTTKAAGKGTGLGLSVTNKIIELHGGALEIGNRKEGGARATVMFRAHEGA